MHEELPACGVSSQGQEGEVAHCSACSESSLRLRGEKKEDEGECTGRSRKTLLFQFEKSQMVNDRVEVVSLTGQGYHVTVTVIVHAPKCHPCDW